MKKSRKKLIYWMLGKYGAGLKIYLLPEHKKVKGVDDIELSWINSTEIKNKEKWHKAHIQDWEALCLIEGLIKALMRKNLGDGVIFKDKKFRIKKK